MKKLLLTALVMVMGVMNVSASETIWLRNNIGSWNENQDAFKIEGIWNQNAQQDEYHFTLSGSTLGTNDFYFRLYRNNTDFQLGPWNHVDYPFVFENGFSETYTATANDYFKGENGAFLIKHSEIKASEYRISIYVKYPTNADWVFYITVDIVSMPLTVNEYGTFSCGRALDFTDSGVKAYIATSTADSQVTMSPVTKVPANTGLFIQGNGSKDITVIPTTEESIENVSANKLVPTTGADIPAGNYVFANQDGYGFYLLTSDLSGVPAGKAYLNGSGISTARLGMNFGGETTGINGVESMQTNGTAYNMAGQRVAQPTKGLYIVNGKKVIMK